MRPRAVKQAEGAYLLSIMCMLIGGMLQWRMLSAAAGVGATAGAAAFSIGLWSLLLLFATRRGQNWARWGLALVTLFTVLAFMWQVAHGQVPLELVGIMNAGQVVFIGIGAILLFRPEANDWFARPHAGWEEDS